MILQVPDCLHALEGRGIQQIEGNHLAYLANQVKPEHAILELGSYLGKTACYMAWGSKGARVYSVDLWDEGPHKEAQKPGRYYEWVKQVERIGLIEQITPLKFDFNRLAEFWDKPIGLLYIDGQHTYKAVLQDYFTWKDFVVSNGYIAFHDYKPDKFPGVVKAIEEVVIPEGTWEPLALYGSVYSFSKRSE